MPIYSKQFATGVLPGIGPTVVYTVPAGYIAVLRSIDTFVNVGGTAPCSFGLNGAPPCIFAIPPVSIPGGAISLWRGYQVLNSGDALDMNASFPNTSYLISGYLLSTS